MPSRRLLVLADAHFDGGSRDSDTALLRFFAEAPSLGDALLVAGDLFEFWFAWRAATPPRTMPAANALAALAQRMPVSMVGGNHDRWGRPWWTTETAVQWSPRALDLDLDGLRVRAIHGDGLAERPGRSTWTHRLIGLPLTSTIFGALPPAMGLWLVDRAAPLLSEQRVTPAARHASAERQRRWAHQTLETSPDIDMLVMGHTHVPALDAVAAGRHYLNPGAWLDDQRYAIITREGAELRTY